MTYEIILKNEKLKYYNLIRDLLAVMNLTGFIYLLLRISGDFNKTFYFIFIAVTALYVLLILSERISRRKFNDKTHHTMFIWSALGWARSDYWWLSLLLITFLFMDLLAHRKLVVKISENFVEYPSFPSKQIDWSELTNLILKDGLLTLDFKNNKIIQQLIQKSDLPVNETEFNSFCKTQLNKNELYKHN